VAREVVGTSKVPVREALQRIGTGGLLVFETNRGARIPVLSVGDAIENATLRRAVEVELLRQAVPKLNVVDLARAEHALADPTATGSVTEANWQFHRALYRAAQWPRGLAITEMLHAAMAPYVLLYLQSLAGSYPSDDERRALLEACRRGDVDAAIDLLRSHLDRTMHTVIDFLRSAGTADHAER